MLAEREQEPIEHLTPHTLRRTFASILALCEVHPRRARQLMGHEDSRTTADIYEHDLDDSDYAIGLLEGALGCDLAEAHDVFAKRRVSVAKPSRDAKKPAGADFQELMNGKKSVDLQGLQRSGRRDSNPRPSAWQAMMRRRFTV